MGEDKEEERKQRHKKPKGTNQKQANKMIG